MKAASESHALCQGVITMTIVLLITPWLCPPSSINSLQSTGNLDPCSTLGRTYWLGANFALAMSSAISAASTPAQPKLRLFISAADLSNAKIGRLKHPRTAAPMQVALAGEGTATPALLEINKFSESEGEPRSWLIAGAERVQQDGSLFVATKVDPLFLLLPRLRKLRGTNSPGYFKPMSELADGCEDEHEAAAFEATVLALPESALLARMRAVCDVNDKYDEPMLRLNDVKLLAWLRRKTEAVQARLSSDSKLAKLAAQKAQATHSSQFDAVVGIDEPASASAGENAIALASVALVSDYLEPEVQATLSAAFGVSESSLTAQRGPEKKQSGFIPVAAQQPAASSWAADLAEADAEVSAAAKARPRPDENGAPAAKKLKPAAAPKSKAALPLKKGQTTMMGFFAKPK